MEKKYRLFLVLLVFFNSLILLSVWFSYADSHRLLSISAMTDGTFANTAIVVVYCLSVFLALAPYGVGFLLFSIVRYCGAWKSESEEAKPRLLTVIAALPALVFTLAVKYLYIMSMAAEILYPDSFHI